MAVLHMYGLATYHSCPMTNTVQLVLEQHQKAGAAISARTLAHIMELTEAIRLTAGVNREAKRVALDLIIEMNEGRKLTEGELKLLEQELNDKEITVSYVSWSDWYELEKLVNEKNARLELVLLWLEGMMERYEDVGIKKTKAAIKRINKEYEEAVRLYREQEAAEDAAEAAKEQE